MVDVFHTHFGIAGTCLVCLCGRVESFFVFSGPLWFLCVLCLEYVDETETETPFLYMLFLIGLSILGYPGLVDLDPVYCMPAHVIERRGLRKGWQALERRVAA